MTNLLRYIVLEKTFILLICFLINFTITNGVNAMIEPDLFAVTRARDGYTAGKNYWCVENIPAFKEVLSQKRIDSDMVTRPTAKSDAPSGQKQSYGNNEGQMLQSDRGAYQLGFSLGETYFTRLLNNEDVSKDLEKIAMNLFLDPNKISIAPISNGRQDKVQSAEEQYLAHCIGFTSYLAERSYITADEKAKIDAGVKPLPAQKGK